MSSGMLRLIPAGALAVLLSSCGGGAPAATVTTPPRDDWRFDARISIEEGPLEDGEFSLIVPYVLGDMYGGPDSEVYLTPDVNANGAFEIDLNLVHDAMLRELAAREARPLLDKRMRIEPATARFATLSPAIVDRRFKSLGVTNWVNRDSDRVLRLMYFDGPARLTGNDLDIRVTEAGYVWVEMPSSPAIARIVPPPRDLVLVFYRR